ncbi:hypothetical protein BU16DRAFT_537133 [Lophium mytilinum]|uniref:Uncharacterized protein n=1 Tax=Lophium mytilinum TaxID=390894 RepID=A0A6A6QZF4_9PEZI|nr:hypothetical protein BU16DRAFT_537133 [Lophium mytilinum]
MVGAMPPVAAPTGPRARAGQGVPEAPNAPRAMREQQTTPRGSKRPKDHLISPKRGQGIMKTGRAPPPTGPRNSGKSSSMPRNAQHKNDRARKGLAAVRARPAGQPSNNCVKNLSDDSCVHPEIARSQGNVAELGAPSTSP